MIMKIELELPDWVNERAIHILAGIERVAYKLPWACWMVKTNRCSMCGECCRKIDCPYLEKEPGNNDRWRCSLGTKRSYDCCTSRPKKMKNCTIKFKKVE